MRFRRGEQATPTDGQSITATIGDVRGGQIAVGNQIVQSQTVAQAPVTDAELGELRDMFEALREQVLADVPPHRVSAALERVEELEQATFAEQPDVTTMAYVGRWFGKNLPRVAGAVTGLVIHPIVGKLVGAAGDALVAEFRT